MKVKAVIQLSAEDIEQAMINFAASRGEIRGPLLLHRPTVVITPHRPTQAVITFDGDID
jgi:hypothetical protein